MSRNRFVNRNCSEIQEANRSPIFGYEDSPLLTLEKSVEKITPSIDGLMNHVSTAKNNCSQHSSFLNRDESAAIYLYSMGICFFSSLNTILRAEDRHALKPWFPFLKLFITALQKLPSIDTIVWRGVNFDDTTTFVDDETHIWWSINSCSADVSIIKSYLGPTGTLFAIEIMQGKDISQFSAIPDEREIVLLPGTHVQRKYESLSIDDRYFILHLKEVDLQREQRSKTNYLFDQIRQEYLHNNRLHRLINPTKSFPIDESYINLVMVTAKDQQEKECQMHELKHGDALMGTYEDIYGVKTSIDVKKIFQSCKSNKKQVMVLGRAGIGKSTFCQYIAYQWAKRLYWLEYELLAVIPLRRLTTDRYPPGKTYSLIDLVKKEAFPYELLKEEEPIFEDQFDSKKTLWVLDGYDEIRGNLPKHLESLFEHLRNTPNHILTSRPYLNTLSYDVQMEITGLTDENIHVYVDRFFYQIEDEQENKIKRKSALVRLLQSNQSIWGIAHIPINLELICSVWSNQDPTETTNLTIALLYTAITEWLCRRYLAAQNHDIQTLSEDEVHEYCHKELLFLESLAFRAMETNTIVIRPLLLKKILRETNNNSQEYIGILKMGLLKNFDKQGTGYQAELKKDHYFIHLSFQEYFAARYLIRLLTESSIEAAKKIINRQKYNQRYALVFKFIAGILSENYPTINAHTFWNTILGQPLDLVGIRHLQLITSCIDNTLDYATIPCNTEILKWIATFIEFCIEEGNETISRHISKIFGQTQAIINHQILINMFSNLLQNHNPKIKTRTILLLPDMGGSNIPSSLTMLIIDSLNHENTKISSSAWEAIGKIGGKGATDEVINKLVSALEDQNADVRLSACRVFKNMGERAATDEVIKKLVSAVGDENDDVRRSASEALGELGEKAATDEVIKKLVSAVGDENDGVRLSASQALRNMDEKAATDEVISKLVNALGDQSDYVRRSACAFLENIGEEVATDEVINKLVSALEDQIKNVRWSACHVLGNMGAIAATDEVITKLMDALRDHDYGVRSVACQALERIGAKAATIGMIKKLVSALGDQNDYVRSSACNVLGNMGEKAATDEVINKLVSTLGDQNEDVRRSAFRAIAEIGRKAATDKVINKLLNVVGDQNDDVRSDACRCFGYMGEKAITDKVINKLVSALEDQNANVRSSACHSLGYMGEKAATNEVISKLVSILEDQNYSVKSSACNALRNIGAKAATDEVINKLISALEDQNYSVRSDVCHVFGDMGKKVATNEMINKLLSTLDDQNDYVRSMACQALEDIGEKVATDEVIKKLVKALEDQNRNVRLGACQALRNMGTKAAADEVISKLVSALGDRDHRVRRGAGQALGVIGKKAATDKVISELLNVLENQSDYVRMSACEALANMSEKAATVEVINKLMRVLGDEDYYYEFRRIACRALEYICKGATGRYVTRKCIASLRPDVFLDTTWSRSWIGDVLESPSALVEFDLRWISDFYQLIYDHDILRNISLEHLIDVWCGEKNADWRFVIIWSAFLRGAGVVFVDDKFVIYETNEPTETAVTNLDLRNQLIETFTVQMKKLHLFLEVTPHAS